MRLHHLIEEEKRTKSGFQINIEKETIDNNDYRRVLFTTADTQLVLMSIKPGDEIGMETHNGSQFIRFEGGTGKVVMNGVEMDVTDGDAVVIPNGVEHNVINTSESSDLKLYALYSPPEHPEDTVQKTKEEASEAEE